MVVKTGNVKYKSLYLQVKHRNTLLAKIKFSSLSTLPAKIVYVRIGLNTVESHFPYRYGEGIGFASNKHIIYMVRPFIKASQILVKFKIHL